MIKKQAILIPPGMSAAPTVLAESSYSTVASLRARGVLVRKVRLRLTPLPLRGEQWGGEWRLVRAVREGEGGAKEMEAPGAIPLSRLRDEINKKREHRAHTAKRPLSRIQPGKPAAPARLATQGQSGLTNLTLSVLHEPEQENAPVQGWAEQTPVRRTDKNERRAKRYLKKLDFSGGGRGSAQQLARNEQASSRRTGATDLCVKSATAITPDWPLRPERSGVKQKKVKARGQIIKMVAPGAIPLINKIKSAPGAYRLRPCGYFFAERTKRREQGTAERNAFSGGTGNFPTAPQVACSGLAGGWLCA